MKGMVLAAGFGTRLRPLTSERSKAVVPVAGVPAAAWALRALSRPGIREVAVNLHHLPESVTAALEPHVPEGVQVTWSPEPGEILGTGGGIRRAAELLGASTLVVANGDVVCDLDIESLLAHHEQCGAEATLALVPHPDHEQYGTVRVTPDGSILSIAGTRALGTGSDPGPDETPAVFTGIQVLGPAALERLPVNGCVVRQMYFHMLQRGIRLAGYLHRGYWNDIGTPARYLECNLHILHGRAGTLRPAWAHEEGRLVHPDARIHASARLGTDVVVGAGAELAAGARVSRCVIWDGVHVDGEHHGCVISNHHVVQVQE